VSVGKPTPTVNPRYAPLNDSPDQANAEANGAKFTPFAFRHRTDAGDLLFPFRLWVGVGPDGLRVERARLVRAGMARRVGALGSASYGLLAAGCPGPRVSALTCGQDWLAGSGWSTRTLVGRVSGRLQAGCLAVDPECCVANRGVALVHFGRDRDG